MKKKTIIAKYTETYSTINDKCLKSVDYIGEGDRISKMKQKIITENIVEVYLNEKNSDWQRGTY